MDKLFRYVISLPPGVTAVYPKSFSDSSELMINCSRKRSASIAARHKEQHDRAKGKDKDAPEKPAATLKKAATTGGNRGEALSEKQAGKRKEAVDAAFVVGDGGGSTRRPGRVGDKAPSLDVDIRTSLILPG